MAMEKRVLHAPIRVYLIDAVESTASDVMLLDELKDYQKALYSDEFEMTPCTIRGRPFTIARRTWTTPSSPMTMRDSHGFEVARGNSMVLGYDEDTTYRGLTDEEVMHLDETVTMTITFYPTTMTHYIMNDVNVVTVEDEDDEV